MDKIDDLCRSITQNVKDTRSCAIVDLDLGLLLGTYNSSQQIIDESMVAACIDLLRGANLPRLEKIILKHRGLAKSKDKFFQEIYITSLDNYLLAKIFKEGKVAVMLLVNKSANTDTTWAQLKLFIPAIEASVS
ncbi:MAG: hypothetical protein HY819_08730 [Acidobacteria bacterium]|nr:hypothetical protein [Acidobacteriota bacterium]